MAENDSAIVIGINEYVFLPADDHLKYAVNDAVKVRQFLCEQAKFPQENVLLCCDSAPGVTPNQRPNRNGLRHRLKNEIQRAKSANNFWFFYAGHGIVHEHQDFLLPCDGNPRDLEQTAIPINFVTDCLRDCGATNVVLVLDMCRNRTRGTDEGSRDIGEVMGEQTLEIAKERGIVTLFSCSRGERSYEIKDLEQGVFTYALLEGLKQSTTPRALEQYLTKRVPALNNQYRKPIQTPMVIPEPGCKYDRPLLLSCATDADIKEIGRQAWKAEAENELASERGVDYTRLRDLLKAGKWKEADEETSARMCEVMGRQEGDYLRNEDIEKFPCTDLRTIDQLWVTHSQNRFGFSIQKKIWQQCGSPTNYNRQWEKFGETIGWLFKKGLMGIKSEWKSYADITFDTSAPIGHLPCLGEVGIVIFDLWIDRLFFLRVSLLSRAKTCRL